MYINTVITLLTKIKFYVPEVKKIDNGNQIEEF